MSKDEESVEEGQPRDGTRKISIDEALRMATELHRMGRLEEAQALYRIAEEALDVLKDAAAALCEEVTAV